MRLYPIYQHHQSTPGESAATVQDSSSSFVSWSCRGVLVSIRAWAELVMGQSGGDGLVLLLGRSGGKLQGAASFKFQRQTTACPHLKLQRPLHLPLLLATHDSFSSSATGHGVPTAEASMAERRPHTDQRCLCAKSNRG